MADPGGWDWVRLTSDEWVKGKIVVMRDFELKLDSDEFDVVTFDWDDVPEIVTSRRYIVTLQNLRTSVQGTFTMKDDRVQIRDPGSGHRLRLGPDREAPAGRERRAARERRPPADRGAFARVLSDPVSRWK